MTRDTRAPSRPDPLLIAGSAGGALLLAAAAVPTAVFAEAFAHPARMARLGGAIPEATVRGAEFLRIALVACGICAPLLVWWLTRLCPRTSERRAPRALPATRTAWLALGAAAALGALVRIALARQSLWYDEISAFLSFAIEGPGVAFGSYAVPTNHVPMTLATWAAWSLAGSTDELVLRAPAILAGIAAIPVAYALGATTLGRRAALPAAFAAAVAPILVLESVEARGYAFVILGSLVATLALARALRTRARGDLLVFAAASAFAAWAHPVAILLPFAAGLIGLARDRRLAVASLLAGILAITLLSPLAGDVLATRADYARSAEGQPAVFSREGYEALCGLSLAWSGPVPWMPNPFLAIAAACGVPALVRSRRARAALLPAALGFALALVLPLALGTWIYARFLLFAVPLGVALLAAASTPTRANARVPRAAAIAALVAAGSALSLWSFASKQPIRDAVEIVAGLRSPSDRVATVGLPDNAVGFYAFERGFDATPTGFLGADLPQVLARIEPAFVVVLYPERLADGTLAALDAGYDRTHRLDGWADWGQGDVEIWTRSGRPGS